LKRFVAFILCLLLLFGAAVGVLTASAQTKVTVPDRFRILAGEFGSSGESNARRPENASYAWLEEVFIRESVSSLVYSEVVPIDSYPHKSTLASFQRDVKEFMDLLDEAKDPVTIANTIVSYFDQVRIALYTLGLDASEAEQRIYLEDEEQIKFPDAENSTPYDSMMTTLLYAVKRYNLGQALFGISAVTLPAGVWLEEAAVLTMKSYFNSENDFLGNITTLRGLAVALMRAYLYSQKVDVPAAATEEEVITTLFITIVRQAGYTNAPSPDTMIDDQLDAYELGAEIFMRFGVMCEPGALMLAIKAENPSEAVSRLILETMVREKSNLDVTNMPTEDLFTQTLILGYFELGSDFYSDVYEYNVQLSYKRDKFYLSAFSYAPLMEPMGLSDNVTIKVNGTEAKLLKPITIGLDLNEPEQLVDLEIHYRDDSKGVNQTQHYVFHIFQGTQDPPANEDNLISSLMKLFDLSGNLGQVFAAVPKSADSLEPTVPLGWVPVTITPYSGSLPPLQTDVFGAVLGANTALPGNVNSAGAATNTNVSGLAALLERLKQDNLWIYVTGGMALLAAAVVFFIRDQKKQEAEHLALGFKPGGKTDKSAKTKKPKPDNRF
jgi:hypothetical protein